MSKRSLFAFVVFALLASACGDSSAPPPTAHPGSLYVDPNRELGEISPLVYGSNYGPWVAVPLGMMPATEQAGITVSLQVVASVRGLSEPALVVPESALLPLPAGTRLLWRVQAVLPDGERVASPTFFARLE